MNKFNFVIIQPAILSSSKNVCITKIYKKGTLIDYDITYNNKPSIEFCKKWKIDFKQCKINKPFLFPLYVKDIEQIKYNCNLNLYAKPRLYKGSQKLNQKLMMLKLKGKLKGNVDYYISTQQLKNTKILNTIEPIRCNLNWYHKLKNNDKCLWSDFALELDILFDFCNLFFEAKEILFNTVCFMNIKEANKYVYKNILPYVVKYAKHLLHKDKNKYKRLP